MDSKNKCAWLISACGPSFHSERTVYDIRKKKHFVPKKVKAEELINDARYLCMKAAIPMFSLNENRVAAFDFSIR